jgi:hypothetical protein
MHLGFSSLVTIKCISSLMQPLTNLYNLFYIDCTLFMSTTEKKGKVIPVTGRGGPQGCETSRLPQFLDNRLNSWR